MPATKLAMDAISAIVPTLNRPAFLEEAIQSLLNQTLPPAEIVVVDDGSTPPVDARQLKLKFGSTIRVIRNEESRGLAYARNRGVEAATGEYVVHLDDDDLLAPETLMEAHALLENDGRLEVVFLGVEAFGARAEHFNRVQPEAVARMIKICKGQEVATDLIYFGREVMEPLLRAVPAAFQHVMLRKRTWGAVSTLRWRAYRLMADVPDDEAAKRRIIGQLRDSEWAIYAAAACSRTALLNRPRYLFRCEGQNYSSQPANVEKHTLQGLGIKSQLFRASLALPELRDWKKVIRESFAAAQFDTAYLYFQKGYRGASWSHLRQALRLNPSLAYARFAFRMWLPRDSKQKTD